MPVQRAISNGFTLVELVCTISILGVLAAVAVPRFISLSTAANIAAAQGMYGAVGSAATLGFSKYLAAGLDSSLAGQYVTINGVSVQFNYGYPAASADGIAALVDVTVPSQHTCGTGYYVFVLGGATGNCNISYFDGSWAFATPDRRAQYSVSSGQC